MLCPSCRRQLERGATWCGSCGSPLGGASAPLELVLGDATRVPVVADMTVGRAPGSTLVLGRPLGLAHARADLARQRRGAADRGRRVVARHVRRRRPRDRARCRCATARGSGSATPSCAVERRRDASEAGRTIVVRAGRAWSCRRPAGRARPARRRSSGCGRACAPATRSSGSRRARATAAGCSRTSRAGPSCASATTTRSCCEQLDGEHSLADLIGDAEARFGAAGAGAAGAAAGRPRRARLPGRRQRHADRHGRRAAAVVEARGQAAREDVRRRRPAVRRALPARRLGAVHAAGADRPRRCSRRPASACSRT